MMTSIEISEGASRSCAVLDLKDLSGIGRINPRLQLYFEGRPSQYTRVVLDDVTLRLEFRNELIGEGRAAGVEIFFDRSVVTFEVATCQRLLRYVTDALTSNDSVLQLEARIRGRARSFVDESAPPGFRTGSTIGWEPGKWWSFAINSGMPTALQVSRGDWFQRVLTPTRAEQYRYLEVSLPADDKALAVEWKSAVELLIAAERAFAIGDDPGVFLQLRGALDSLPGAKLHILDGIKDERKREDLDGLLKQAGTFLHDGRHVASGGELDGTFPVDHIDAALAIDLMRVLFSHLSLMLSAQRSRAAE